MADVPAKLRQLIAQIASKNHKMAKRTLSQCISEGLDLNVPDRGLCNALLSAVKIGARDITWTLVQHGVDINYTCVADGSSPLLWSCKNNYTDICRLLLINGADANVTDHYNHTPLYWAVNHNNEAVAKLLLQYGAYDDSVKRHVWEIVIRNNRVAPAKLLLEDGYSPTDTFTAEFAVHRKQLKVAVSYLEQLFSSLEQLFSRFLIKTKQISTHLIPNKTIVLSDS